MSWRAVILVVAGASCLSCNGTTGGALVTFSAYASGATGASEPFVVNGFSVHLTAAKMRIGAVYVDEAPQAGVAEGPECIDPGVYNAQVPGGIEVDLMSATPQEFSVFGNGTADTGQSWQMWLTDGNINEANLAHIVDLSGVATRVSDGAVFSFGAVVTINMNRTLPVSDPAQPGLNPICKQRIVQVTGIQLTPFQGGALYVTIDPRQWFNLNIDFSQLPSVSDAECLLDPNVDFGDADYCIPDTNFASGAGSSAGQALFSGILTGGPAAYSIAFERPHQ